MAVCDLVKPMTHSTLGTILVTQPRPATQQMSDQADCGALCQECPGQAPQRCHKLHALTPLRRHPSTGGGGGDPTNHAWRTFARVGGIGCPIVMSVLVAVTAPRFVVEACKSVRYTADRVQAMSDVTYERCVT